MAQRWSVELARGPWPTIDCLGVHVSRPTWPELKDWLLATGNDERRQGDARSLFFVNAHTLNLASRDPAYRAVLNRSDVVLNDGVGLALYGKLAGAPFANNFNGTDLFPRLFREAEGNLTVFLFGAIPGRAERAAARIEARYSNVRVVGTRDGFTKDSVLEFVNAARPDLLLVGLGNPRQEVWIDANLDRLEVGVVAGVGALIDFLSGAVPRAPKLLRRARLEWAYRLAREPRRLFGRYVIGNPAFVARSVRYLAATRARSRE
jgi:exopolysaccharide biosynthesis WecB/TagA/CpsF family protein